MNAQQTSLPSAQELMERGKTAGKPKEEAPQMELPEVVTDESPQLLATQDQRQLVNEFKNRQAPATARANVFGQLIESQMQGIQAIMPEHMTFKRLKEIMVLQLKQVPKLLECEPVDLMQAVYQAAALGLEPYSQMGEFYIIPYGKTPQVIIGFKGLRKLAMNSGELSAIDTQLVYQGDVDQGTFTVEFGTSPSIYHRPNLFSDRGALVGVYAVARFKDDSRSPVMEFMSIADIEHVKKSSKAGTGSGTPWGDHYGEMARKTVLRRIVKSLPLAVTPVSLVKALAMDNAHQNGQNYVIDMETGEAISSNPTKALSNDLMDV